MTQQEIEDIIENEASQHAELNELQTNSSLMAVWLYAKKVIAYLASIMYGNMETFKEEVTNLIDSSEMGQPHWYVQQMLDFQYGHQLINQNNLLVYADQDEDSKIIKRCALKQKPDLTLEFRLAKEDGNGNLIPLTFEEINAATFYINRKKIYGTKIEMISLLADLLEITATIKLSPAVFTSAGINILTGLNDVEIAINSYLKSFEFGGIFYNSELIDKVMGVPGVIDFDLQTTKLNTVAYNASIEVPSGYLNLTNTNITYVLL